MKLFIVAFLLSFSSLFAKSEMPLVYLTWQHDPTTTMVIQWVTNEKTSANTIFYREQKNGAKWLEAVGSVRALTNKKSYQIHRVELQKLKPDQIYRFHFGDQKKSFLFRTMPKDLSKPVRFVTGGDAYNNNLKRFRKMNKMVAKTNPRFAIIGGDIAYTVPVGGKNHRESFTKWKNFFSCWMQEMKDKDGCLIPLFVTIGNHEVKGGFHRAPEHAPFYYALFEKAYYHINFANYAHFTFLDSNHTHPVKGRQTDWLNAVLKNYRNCPHRFVTYHVGAYPSTGKINDPTRKSIHKYWVPLFEKYRVHACFESHDHAYKRTHPLMQDRIHSQGVVYIGDGSWGVKPRKPEHTKKRPYLASSAQNQQVLVVELSKDARKYWARDVSGKVIDYYEQSAQ